MKHQPSQFEESLEQLLQAVPIPERTDHTAELRARVLNDYRERQSRHAKPKQSFMHTLFTRLFLATSAVAAVFILGAVLYSQPAVQTQVAKLRGTETNPTPVNSIITQLSPQEVFAKSVEQTFNTSSPMGRFVRARMFQAPDDSEFYSEERLWVQDKNVRSDTYGNNGNDPTIPESAMEIQKADGSIVACALQVGFSCERLASENGNSAPLSNLINGIGVAQFLNSEYQTALQNGEIIESRKQLLNGVEQFIVTYRYTIPGINVMQDSIFYLNPQTYEVLRIEELPNAARLQEKTRVTEIIDSRELTNEEAMTVFTIDHWEKTIIEYYRTVLQFEPPVLTRNGF
jgi:hypothetical protein